MSDVALITGAAGALGAEVAKRLHARGYALALVDSPRAATKLDEMARGFGSNACAATGDLATAAAWDSVLPKIASTLGAAPTRAALIAGAWRGGARLFEEKTDDTWTAMMQANLETAHRALRALLPAMVRDKRGSIVVVGSRAAEQPWTGARAAAYTASKAALVALAQAVAQEVLADGVRVNAILPSTMDTPANRASMPNADFSAWVTTASAAAVVDFLLSDDARDVSGAALPVYGRS